MQIFDKAQLSEPLLKSATDDDPRKDSEGGGQDPPDPFAAGANMIGTNTRQGEENTPEGQEMKDYYTAQSKKTLRKYLIDNNQHKTRETTDPTRGLVLSQGTLLQHFVFAIAGCYIIYRLEPMIVPVTEAQATADGILPSKVIFWDRDRVDPVTEEKKNPCTRRATDYSQNVLMCEYLGDDETDFTEEWIPGPVCSDAEAFETELDQTSGDTPPIADDSKKFYIRDYLGEAIYNLMRVHICCFVLQTAGLWWSSTNKQSHVHNVLTMITVPFYQAIILQAYYFLSETEDVAAATVCDAVDFSRRRAWVYIEIMGFFVNLVQLVIYLLLEMQCREGISNLCTALYKGCCYKCQHKVSSDDSQNLLRKIKTRNLEHDQLDETLKIEYDPQLWDDYRNAQGKHRFFIDRVVEQTWTSINQEENIFENQFLVNLMKGQAETETQREIRENILDKLTSMKKKDKNAQRKHRGNKLVMSKLSSYDYIEAQKAEEKTCLYCIKKCFRTLLCNKVYDTKLVLVNPRNPYDCAYVEALIDKISSGEPSKFDAMFDFDNLDYDPIFDINDKETRNKIYGDFIKMKSNTFQEENLLMEARRRIENIQLKTFIYNMRLNDEELGSGYLHTMTTERLELAVAKEYMETDMLKMFEIKGLFRRINNWQILTILFTIVFYQFDLVFCRKINQTISYKERCKFQVDVSVMPSLVIFLVIHILDNILMNSEAVWCPKGPFTFYRYPDDYKFKLIGEEYIKDYKRNQTNKLHPSVEGKIWTLVQQDHIDTLEKVLDEFKEDQEITAKDDWQLQVKKIVKRLKPKLIKPDDQVQDTDLQECKDQKQSAQNCARKTFWIQWVIRCVLFCVIGFRVLRYNYCEPLLSMCFYMDWGVSVVVQIWVLLESHILGKASEAIIKSVILNDVLETQKHFFKLRYAFINSLKKRSRQKPLRYDIQIVADEEKLLPLEQDDRNRIQVLEKKLNKWVKKELIHEEDYILELIDPKLLGNTAYEDLEKEELNTENVELHKDDEDYWKNLMNNFEEDSDKDRRGVRKLRYALNLAAVGKQPLFVQLDKLKKERTKIKQTLNAESLPRKLQENSEKINYLMKHKMDVWRKFEKDAIREMEILIGACEPEKGDKVEECTLSWNQRRYLFKTEKKKPNLQPAQRKRLWHMRLGDKRQAIWSILLEKIGQIDLVHPIIAAQAGNIRQIEDHFKDFNKVADLLTPSQQKIIKERTLDDGKKIFVEEEHEEAWNARLKKLVNRLEKDQPKGNEVYEEEKYDEVIISDDYFIQPEDILSKNQKEMLVKLSSIPENIEEQIAENNELKLNPDDQNFVCEEDIKESFYKAEDKMQIDLEQDIYCIGFRTFLRTTNVRALDRITLKCVFCIVFQVTVLLLILKEYMDFSGAGDEVKSTSLISSMVVGKPTLNMARLCCCFLLHVQLLPELRQGMSMLMFCKYNPTAFAGQRFEYPMMFAIFKTMGGMFCFFANVLILSRAPIIEDVIKDFIAVEIIAQIDDLMAYTVTGLDRIQDITVFLTNERAAKSDGLLLEDYVFDVPASTQVDVKERWRVLADANSEKPQTASKTNYERQIEEAMADGNYEEPLHPYQKGCYCCGMIIYRVLYVVYTAFYYYFAPFTVTILIIFAQLILEKQSDASSAESANSGQS